MPLSPNSAIELVKVIRDIYTEAEEIVLTKLARQLARGIESESWADRKYADLQELNRQLSVLVDDLNNNVPGAVERAMMLAYNRGVATAVTELQGAGLGAAATAAPPVSPSVAAFTRATMGALGLMPFRILRWTDDVYSRVTRETTAQVLTGAVSRREASAAALKRYAVRGVTGFQDVSGRNWSLASFAEMAARTQAAQASLQGHTDRLQDLGMDLVIVSNAPEECSLCLIPGTTVEGPAPTGRSRLEYTGNVVTITTASGKNLTGTPNHTVLTPSGWVRLDKLVPGDKVVSDAREHDVSGVVPDHVQVPALIEEAGEASVPLLLSGPTRRDFDKGVSYREVRAELPDGYLLGELDASFGQPLRDLFLVSGVGTAAAGASAGDAFQRLDTVGLPAPCVMGGLDHGSPLLGGSVRPPLDHGLANDGGSLLMGEALLVGDDPTMAGAGFNASAAKVVGNDSATDSVSGPEILGGLPGKVAGDELGSLGVVEGAGSLAVTDGLHAPAGEGVYEPFVADAKGGHELLLRLAGDVTSDEIVDVSVSHYSGHVWDLTTEPSWFIANGIVTHNCRPWEGKVLTMSGNTTGELSDGVTVAGSVPDATTAGLYHANCRHSQTLYLPGITKRFGRTEDPEGDALRQRQRAYERRVREWRRRVLIDDELLGKNSPGARATRAKLRQAQAEMRTFIEENGRKSLPYRTSLTAR